MFEINYSQLIQYEILEKLVTYILKHILFNDSSKEVRLDWTLQDGAERGFFGCEDLLK